MEGLEGRSIAEGSEEVAVELEDEEEGVEEVAVELEEGVTSEDIEVVSFVEEVGTEGFDTVELEEGGTAKVEFNAAEVWLDKIGCSSSAIEDSFAKL